MHLFLTVLAALLTFVTAADGLAQQRRSAGPAQKARTLSITTEPKSTIWIDGIKRGITGEDGSLKIFPVRPAARRLMIRADGFREVSRTIARGQRTINVKLVKTSDRAALLFQEAERNLADDKEKAIELYQQALKLRPGYIAARVALVRALTGSDNESALKHVAAIRRIRPGYALASVIEARVFRSDGNFDAAIEAFEQAIREGKGFQPEAHTGLGLMFKSEAESAGAAGDPDDESYYYTEAAASFEKAIDQLSATEPVIYLLLGAVYEKMNAPLKAIAVYERFIRDLPDNPERTAVESFIVQLQKEMASEQ